MSRSYKNPHVDKCKAGRHIMRKMKRVANKAVRHAAEVANGRAFRRIWNSWDLCDHRSWDSDARIEEFVDLGLAPLHHFIRK